MTTCTCDGITSTCFFCDPDGKKWMKLMGYQNDEEKTVFKPVPKEKLKVTKTIKQGIDFDADDEYAGIAHDDFGHPYFL